MRSEAIQPQLPQQQALGNLGPCRSWKEQQKNIEAFLQLRSLRSASVPRLLLAQFNDETITVYQAYNESIASPAVARGNFLDSEFSFARMTWIKPNFSWMMYRSGWASKKNQERVLAVKLTRAYFEDLLGQAVPTSWDDSSYASTKEWSKALKDADVLVQWDPDHHLLHGKKLPYRVIQLGIRGSALEGFKGSGIVSITDITEDVHRLRRETLSKPLNHPDSGDAETPSEKRYPVSATIQTVQRLN